MSIIRVNPIFLLRRILVPGKGGRASAGRVQLNPMTNGEKNCLAELNDNIRYEAEMKQYGKTQKMIEGLPNNQEAIVFTTSMESAEHLAESINSQRVDLVAKAELMENKGGTIPVMFELTPGDRVVLDVPPAEPSPCVRVNPKTDAR